MLKIKNNRLEIKTVKTLSKKQMRRIETLKKENPNDVNLYIKSLVGEKQRGIYQHKTQVNGRDLLTEKPKNNILNIKQHSLDTWRDHKPYHIEKTFGQWVGVEIECYIPDIGSESSCEYCDGSGTRTCYNCDGRGRVNLEDENGYTYHVDCACCDGNGDESCGDCDGSSGGDVLHSHVCDKLRDSIKKANIPFVTLKTDGSLSEDGIEITLLFNATRGFEPLEKLCKILSDFEASVGSSCGLHVHLDHRDIDSSQLVDIKSHWTKYLDWLSNMVPKSRRQNHFCKLRVSREKYSAVNLGTFDRYGTIEIRLHSGSTNFIKIKNWIEVLRRIKARSKKKIQESEINSFKHLVNNLKLPDDVAKYIEKRIETFAASKQTEQDFDDSLQNEVA
jgi:hypothetical protein